VIDANDNVPLNEYTNNNDIAGVQNDKDEGDADIPQNENDNDNAETIVETVEDDDDNLPNNTRLMEAMEAKYGARNSAHAL